MARAHTAKVGGIVSLLDYDVRKLFNGNPLFTYRGDISWNFPARANFGAGDPDLNARNHQAGVFVQDDWAVTPRLTLNLGLRWDYESDMLNNDYVTPENVRMAAAPFVDASRYFTDGDDRPAFYDAWQPRLGFSYDVMGNGQTMRLRRVGPLLRSRALQLDARRAFPPAVRRSHVSSSRRAAGFATASRRSCGIPRT